MQNKFYHWNDFKITFFTFYYIIRAAEMQFFKNPMTRDTKSTFYKVAFQFIDEN